MANDDSNRILDPFRSDVFSTGIFERPGRILLIEDDQEFARIVCEMLERQNHTVATATTGKLGLESAHTEEPDLVLLDIKLPDMAGFDVCKTLKKHPELRYVPVVLLTGMSSPDVHVEAINAGANDFLAKPFSWPVFQARVSSLLKYRRAVSTLRRARTELEKRVAERTNELQESNERLLREVTDRRRAEAALRESEERYALAARAANDGLWDWNLELDSVYFSPRWKSMIGAAETEVGEAPTEWFRRVHPEDRDSLEAAVDAHLSGASEYLEIEYRILYKDGTYRWMITRGMAIRGEDGKATRMAGSQSDITVRKMAELQLLHNAFHDELTRLPNRALFLDRLQQTMKRNADAEDWNIAILHLDIDRFKIVNDSLGHMAGNQLLIEMGRRLRKCLQPLDTVARLGGDEFALLVENVRNLDEANQIAGMIHDVLKEPFKLRERDVFVTTSVGIVIGKKKYSKAEDMLRDSETAMHRAKAQGKARQEMFHSGMHAQVLTVLHLENDLRRASNANEFLIYYQPIVSVKTGKLSAFEALIRWKHPERGIVSPGEFLPIAEETELITPMSMWVMREACSQLKQWQQRYPAFADISVSVNLSGTTFSQPTLVDQVKEVLQQTKLPGSSLKIEITEGVIMGNIQAAIDTLTQFTVMDVHLLVDDFGTGYSSLSYLHRLPIDVLKIDHSFVSNLDQGGRNLAIVKTIMALASNLKLKVVAEGVETAHQLAVLREMNCDYAQGYLFARPAPAADVERWLATNKQWSDL
jgi:diguanylate cyclase (GGDEF)-like protein/PAS domain S-box-containing protein